MEKVVKLTSYRVRKQKAWLVNNKQRLFRFLYDFISLHMGMNFLQAFHTYQNTQLNDHQEAWDYTDLRDLLHDSMSGPFSDHLYSELQKQWWFDRRLLSKEEALEQCLSLYIMDSLHGLSVPK